MNRSELDYLKAERGEVLRILNSIPKDRVVDRGSTEYRLRQLEALIEEAGHIPMPAKAVLTFKGKPVVGGSHGIYYDFATKAISTFADAVAKLAVHEDETMGERGRIPGKQLNSLMITNTAVGSFGFELEEAPTDELKLDEESPTAQALAQVTDILANTRSTDEDLARSISDAHPRALNSVREFLEHLAKNDAVVTVAVKDKIIRFTQVAEVQQSLDRLKTDNVHASEQFIRGRFQGVLPHRRTFEFIKDGESDPIVGKVQKGVENISSINEHLNKAVDAKFKVTSVGDGRPSYVLVEVPTW